MKNLLLTLLLALVPGIAWAQSVSHPADVTLTAGQATTVAEFSDPRISIEVVNTGSGDLRCAQGATATVSRGFPILPGGSLSLQGLEGPQYAISCWTTAGTTVSVASRLRQ